MQTTSATWKNLWAGEGTRLESRVTIAGTVYPETTAPVINRALMQNGLGVGNAVSATCGVTVRTDSAIPRSAEVVVEMRLTNGTTNSEWLPAGTFYISRRERDPASGLLTLGCYDALLKGNAVWEPGAGAWPRSMASVAAELAGLLGVSMDSRTAIPTSAPYILDEPTTGTTIHDALGTIAQACGGNWIITSANRLRLVPVRSAADAPSAVADAVDVIGVVSRLGMSAAGSVTGVRDTWEDEVYLTGTEDGIVLDVSLPPALAAGMAEDVIGETYQPYALSGAIYDPAAELGDYVRAGAGGEIASVLCSEVATLGIAFRGDIGAPEPGEMADEYPYIGATARALSLAKAYAREVTDEFDASLDQRDIFNRLTDSGQLQGLYMLNGELYVNASYIQSGTISADRIYGGILTLGGANNVNGQMQVLDANGNVVGTWDNASIKVKSANGDYQASVTNGQFALFGYLIPDGSNVPQWLPLVEFRGSSTDGTLGNAKGIITGNAPLVLGDSAKPVSMEYKDATIYPNVLVRLGIEGGGSGTGQYIVSHPELFRKALGIGNSNGAFPIPVEQGGTGQTSLQAARNAMGLGNTTGALPAANGGTGQTSLQAARNAMGLGNTTGALPVANGGTGATAEAAARANLGFGTEAMNFRVANTTGANQAFLIYATVQNGNYPGRYGHTLIFYPSETGIGLFDSTDGQSIWTITDKGDPVTIAHGGTGADSAAAARANLGAAALSDIVLATGQYAPGNIPAGGRGSTTITFPSVGTTNYMVLCNPLLGDISCGVQSKTATSFTLFYRNNDSSARNGTVNWAVIKLP